MLKVCQQKKCGVTTGEPIYFARKKCSNLKVYPANHKIYKEYSDKLFSILSEYTDKIERFSIDECFLDMTEYLRKDTLLNKGIEINRRVKQELGFTVNVGVANNKLLAKMASDFEKPDKVHTLFKDEIQSKMWNLPVKELFMLGKKTIPKLLNLNIKTIEDLAKTDKIFLIKKFGKHGKLMWEYANGIDNSPVSYIPEKPKGIGNSVTLPKDVNNIEKLEEILFVLAEQVTYRLRKHELLTKTVNVQLRTNEFKDISHQRKLLTATSNTKEIYNMAKVLLKELYKTGMQIRLIGLRVDNLEEKNETQLSLFTQDKKQEKIDKAIDAIKEKYGYNSITRAKKLN